MRINWWLIVGLIIAIGTIILLASNKDAGVVLESNRSCSIDSDCVKDSCCHASGCVNKDYAPNCEGIACTMECAPGTLDCGGKCGCVNNECTASFSGGRT